MSVTVSGFVGLHPKTAYTRNGEKVLHFSLGSRSGNLKDWREIALTGKLADQYERLIKPGSEIKVLGELRRRQLTRQYYIVASHIEISAEGQSRQVEFPFVA